MENENKVFAPRRPAVSGKRKKKILIASVAAVLAVALVLTLVLLLIPKSPALTYHGVSIDSEMYAFWYSMLKTEFMRSYGLSGTTHDTAAVWDSPCPHEGAEGKTWGEVLDADIHRAIQLKLISAVMYDELGLEMADNQRARVESYCDDMREYVADGSSSELRSLLETYGTTPSALRRCAVIDLKSELLWYQLSLGGASHMGGDDLRYLSAEEIMKEYSENYRRVKIVYVNDSVYGSYVNGERIEIPLDFTGPGAQNDDDKKELDGYVKNGGMTPETFDTYLKKSDEEIHAAGAYPSGIYLKMGTDLSERGFLEKAVAEALYGVEPGELVKVETSRGVRYLYGYELDNAAFLREESKAFFGSLYSDAAEGAITARAAAELSEVVEHTENYEELNVYTIPYNKGFKLCTMG